jgi:murein DD-endopeptidase MepM/ murein hydrolase activator NlpD
MPLRRSVLPAHAAPGRRAVAQRKNPAAGGLAVLIVGGLVTATIVTGTSASAARPTATRHVIGLIDNQPLTPMASSTLPDVSSALGETTRKARARAVSRAEHRRRLHRWVRPFWGVFTSGFGMRWGRLHAGIDLAGPYGAAIVAATDGCITYAGPEGGYGEVMRINDWDGTQTVYGHMSAFVRQSGCVRAGQVIARIGEGGDATGPHLHFEVRINGVPVDPVPFLARRGVRI